MEQERESSLFELSVDQPMTNTLRTASQWGRFLAVLGFILGVLILIFGVVIYNRLTPNYNGAYRGSGVLRRLALRYLIICLLFAGVFFTGAIFTLNFSNRVIDALNMQNQYLLNSGFAAIKAGIIFWAIVFVVFIFLVLLMFIGLYSI